MRASSIVRMRAARDRGNVQRPATRTTPKLASYFISADVGEPEVEQHDIGFERIRLLERLAAAARGLALVPHDRQKDADDFGTIRLIVDDQNACLSLRRAHVGPSG